MIITMFLSLILRKKSHSKFISFIFASNLLLALIMEMCLFGVNAAQAKLNQEYQDNEFAEFEEFEDEEVDQQKIKEPQKTPEKMEEVRVEEEKDDEGDGIVEDEEEFETVIEGEQDSKENNNNNKKEDLKITKVPLHLRSNWESYYIEFMIIGALVMYYINFIAGRNKNQKIAMTWFEAHKELLYSNFALIGDDGKKEIENYGLVKETESIFTLWCSGRVYVDGMLVELRMIKRQDVFSQLINLLKPSYDQIVSLSNYFKLFIQLFQIIHLIISRQSELICPTTQWIRMFFVLRIKR